MDTRTQKNIDSLLPNARDWALAHLLAIEDSGVLPAGFTVRIVSGNRSWQEQDALYAKGRTAPGSKVTNARGGQSNHNFGIAWDIGIFEKGEYLGSSPLYAEIGAIGEDIGLEWGGRWKSITDYPHYQVKTGLSTSELRALILKGKPIPVPPYGGSAKKSSGDKVTIFDNKNKTDIGAFFEGGRVWVAVRLFVERFGGEIVSVDGANFTVNLHDELISMSGTTRDGVGYVKFADLNRVTHWGYSYEAGVLTINSEID
jgi:peptidoglycan L-alanyl-D-glutamate endopeptidase CwlK